MNTKTNNECGKMTVVFRGENKHPCPITKPCWKHKTPEERDSSALEGDHSPDYEEYCNRKLPEEVERLQETGRTGTEAWIARAKYQSRKIRERLGL